MCAYIPYEMWCDVATHLLDPYDVISFARVCRASMRIIMTRNNKQCNANYVIPIYTHVCPTLWTYGLVRFRDSMVRSAVSHAMTHSSQTIIG